MKLKKYLSALLAAVMLPMCSLPGSAAELFVPSLPENSYVYNYNFADTGLKEIERRFTVSEDCMVCIYRSGDPGQRAGIELYDVSDGNRLIYSSSGAPDYYNIYASLKRGHEYAVKAFGSDKNENIYIYAETDEYMWEYYDVYE